MQGRTQTVQALLVKKDTQGFWCHVIPQKVWNLTQVLTYGPFYK